MNTFSSPTPIPKPMKSQPPKYVLMSCLPLPTCDLHDRNEYQWHGWKCVVMAWLLLCSYLVIHVYNFPFSHSSFVVILQAAWIFIKRSAEYKPLQFLAFAFVYRIFEKLKSFEPSVSPTYTVSSLFYF